VKEANKAVKVFGPTHFVWLKGPRVWTPKIRGLKVARKIAAFEFVTPGNGSVRSQITTDFKDAMKRFEDRNVAWRE
jgi:hypothetical protein